MSNNKETRMMEVRAADNDEGKMIIEGYAAVFEEETLIGDEEWGFYEVIDKRAFDNCNMKDVPMKYNHNDHHLILARTRNKSLQLTVDEKGLKIRAELIDTTSNRDIYTMIRSGLLDKMSFAFTVKGEEVSRRGEVPTRRVTDIDYLYDVSVVDTPAYEGTSIYARSLELVDTKLNTLDKVRLAKERSLALAKKKMKIKLGIGG